MTVAEFVAIEAWTPAMLLGLKWLVEHIMDWQTKRREEREEKARNGATGL
jgi:hypothetical protein